MTLTATEQNNIIFYLGWPGKTLISGSTHYDQAIVTRMASLDTDTETNVRSLLTQIASVRTKFSASTSRMLVEQVGDIKLNTHEHAGLRGEYNRLLKDLAILLDIPLLGKSGVNVGVRC